MELGGDLNILFPSNIETEKAFWSVGWRIEDECLCILFRGYTAIKRSMLDMTKHNVVGL